MTRIARFVRARAGVVVLEIRAPKRAREDLREVTGLRLSGMLTSLADRTARRIPHMASAMKRAESRQPISIYQRS